MASRSAVGGDDGGWDGRKQPEDDEEMQALNPLPCTIGSVEDTLELGGVVERPAAKEARPTSDLDRRRPQQAPTVPLYQVWPSENMFCCRGMLMTGGTEECWAPNLCVWTCILVPSTLFFLYVAPNLVSRGAYALPIAVAAVFCVTVCLLCATCCTDPGIVPRREVILATRSGPQLQAALGYDVLGGSEDGKEPAPDAKLRQQGYRWCRTCRIVRPPRASHCPDCDNCVLRYDHHCPFVNNCVGQRNYHFFFGFITCVLILATLVIPSVLTFFSALNESKTADQLSQTSTSLRWALWGLACGGVLVIIASSMSLLLWGYHIFLITTQQTTKEFRRSVTNMTEEPTLCASRGPALFDPHMLVDPEQLPAPGDKRRR